VSALQILQVVLAATVAAGYYVVAIFVVPRIVLDEARPAFARAVRIGATVFFVGCGLTHTHILVHSFEGTAEPEVHEVLFHIGQVGGVWIFALAAVRVLDIRVVRRKTESEELREEVEALSRANADLEDFAHVVSHDLKEPLITIRGFTRLLERRHAEAIGDAPELAGIKQATERMGALLDGMLELSRVAGTGLRREPVDLGEVSEELRLVLAGRLEAVGAQLDVGTLPVVWGDRLQLTQLLQNLVANALKFRDPDRPSIVAVEARAGEQQVELRVRDNGMGIDPADAERLFGLFERVSPDAEGTGIGLAVCQKIAQRHGGSIRHEPTPGGGATFVVTLPQRVGTPDGAGRPAAEPVPTAG
jgi:signal transduction histidine kinase